MIEEKISGIHNYCDRWCERCHFQQRCDVFHDVKALEAGNFTPFEPSTSNPWTADVGMNSEMPSEKAEAAKEYRLLEIRTIAHPISARAVEYGNAVRAALQIRTPMDMTNDPVVAIAWETVQFGALPIRSKSRRAVHELVDAEADDDAVDRTLDPRGIQSDGNGSAKVARLLIGESIAAWRVLGDPADETPYRTAHMIRLLRTLDAELHRAFPFCMEFVRPGFDDRGEPP